MELLVQTSALVGVVITILVQTVTFIWFFSKLDSRVISLEKGFTKIEDHPTKLATLTVLLQIVQKQQDEQSLKLDKILANQAARKAGS